MNENRFYITSSAVVLLAGCIPSLHAVYSKNDVIFDPQLVGVWEPENGDGSWAFEKRGAKSYRLVCTESDGEKGNFIAHLTRFNDTTFLDIAPVKDQIPTNDFHQLYLLPLHAFFRIDELSPSTLKMSVMKPDELEGHLAKNPDAVKQDKLEGGILLTASTDELQAFLSSPEAKPLFTEPASWVWLAADDAAKDE